MKSRLIIATLLVTVFFVSCKNDEKKETAPETKVAEVQSKSFRVSLDLLIKQDDKLHLYYTEDNSINFVEESSVWLEVKGNPTSQKVTFELPKDVYPTQFRLDFGINKDQAPITISSFAINYLQREFKIPGSQFYIFFDPDLTKTVFDKNTATVSAVVKDGVRQSPSFYPNTKPLGDEINKLLK